MGYYEQSLLSQDGQFRDRVAACYAVETTSTDQQPTRWADSHLWAIAAAPGFADAYSSALAGSVPNPGADPSVISDAQLLAAVQAELAGSP